MSYGTARRSLTNADHGGSSETRVRGTVGRSKQQDRRPMSRPALAEYLVALVYVIMLFDVMTNDTIL
jgi:hypothetical protein